MKTKNEEVYILRYVDKDMEGHTCWLYPLFPQYLKGTCWVLKMSRVRRRGRGGSLVFLHALFFFIWYKKSVYFVILKDSKEKNVSLRLPILVI